MIGLFLAIGVLIPLLRGGSPELTLSKLQGHVEKLEEYPPIENDNYINPDYTTYYKDLKGNILVRFFKKIGVLEETVTASSISSKMTEIKKNNKDFGKKSLYLSTKPGDKFVFFGDLHGALHSLYRNLRELKAQGVIDEKLKIRDPTVKIIFMGNLIDRSPYGLETLHVVLTMLARNPGTVIYLRGSHEHEKNWQNYDFRRELEHRLDKVSDNDVFIRSLDLFFAELPTRLYLRNPDGSGSVAAVNSLYADKTSTLLKEEKNIEVLVRNQSRSTFYQATSGLDLLVPEEGIPAWTVFSSPTLGFQKLYHFYKDTFAVLELGEALSGSRWRHVLRDAGKPGEAFDSRYLHLLSGMPLKKEEFIKQDWYEQGIGVPLDLSESASVLGQRLQAGIDLRMRKLHREGGIHGKLLRIYYKNDHYTPSKTLQAVQTLNERKGVHLVLSPLGSPTTKALLPLAREKNLLILFPYTGLEELRAPSLTNMIHFRASYKEEATALVRYAKEKLLKQKFALFYQNDAYGITSAEAAIKLLKEQYGVSEEQICEAAYVRNTLEIEEAAEKIRLCYPDVIFLFSTPAPSLRLFEKLGATSLSNVTLMGVSFLSDRFRDLVSTNKHKSYMGMGLPFVISRVTPSPTLSEAEIVKEYRQEMDRQYPGARLDVDSLEGYINASLLIDALQGVEGPFTQEKLLAKLKEAGQGNYRGLGLKFNPLTRQLSEDVWIDAGSEYWVKH